MVCKSGNRGLVLLLAVVGALVLSPGAAAWSWPVDGPVLRGFTLDDDPYLGGQHRGIDIGAPSASEVRAPVAGVVGFAGSVPSAGLTLTIRTADGYSVTLLHLGSIAVRVGTPLAEQDVVGTVGPSGEAEHAEPYVHLGVRLTAEPHGYLDPLTLLPPRADAERPPAASDPPSTPEPTPAPVAPTTVTQPVAVPPAVPPAVPRSASRTRPGSPGTTRRAKPVASPVVAPAIAEAAERLHVEVRSGVRVPRRTVAVARRSGVDAPTGHAIRGRPALALELDGAPTAAKARSRPRSQHNSDDATQRTGGRRWIVWFGLVGLVLLGAGLLAQLRRAPAPAQPSGDVLRKMSKIRLRLEARLAELDFATDPRRGRMAVRQRPAPHRACSRLRRSVRHLRAVPPTSRRSSPDGERHRRARHARDGRRRSRREYTA